MKIDFSTIEAVAIPCFKGGEGSYIMKQYADANVKIMFGRLEPGSSIGIHRHETTSETMYIVSGVATYVYEGQEEVVMPGQVHYAPKGATHALFNRGPEDLTFFALVSEHP